ncbi:stabilization of polarity axis domain-containing protein [Ditylenchus destructor]|uniref:Stabilization of polarity axis domain-containing protein n=1 Tax=Ditylenchus destructor TaxID=166010 RepID=A0AAD4N4J7_9BILA|nr:stabilization of polarity axis domain-containing protein [Ditylenchus destructor]
MIEGEHDGGSAPWERFREWVYCICVITFDLELGQTIEVIYPGNSELTASERLKADICYLSFPDSNSIRHSTKDSTYHFRVRCATKLSNFVEKSTSSVPAALQPDPNYLFGFVHFRQQRNPSLPRGYYQKSVVLLSPLPLFGLFTHIVSEIALSFFGSCEMAIESACQQIDQWPAPVPGETLSLPFISTHNSSKSSVILCRLPGHFDNSQRLLLDSQFLMTTQSSLILPTIHETDFYTSIRCVIAHIQILWELVLLGEPLLVIAPNPTLCSQLVQSLVSLIWPLRYSNDFRPFFTIHDSDFGDITSKATPPPIMLGVTNPFFSKAFKHWPHILRIGDLLTTSGTQTPSSMERVLKKMSNGKKLDTKPGLSSQHKEYLCHDKSLLKKLLKVGDRPDSVQSAILRRHFVEMTHSFMIPLERYISSLMPLRKHITPFDALPQTKPFILEEFLATLQQTGPLLTCGIKGDWTGLYRNFISSSPNFQGWLSQRLNDMNRQLKIIYLEVLCTADFSSDILASRKEVEIVDLILKLKDRLTDLNSQTTDKGTQSQAARIRTQFNRIMDSVNDELKTVLLSNGAIVNALRDAFHT